MKSNFSTFPFIDQAFGVAAKKFLPNTKTQRSLMFMFTFKSVIHFLYIFVFGVIYGPMFCFVSFFLSFHVSI